MFCEWLTVTNAHAREQFLEAAVWHSIGTKPKGFMSGIWRPEPKEWEEIVNRSKAL